MVISNRLYVNTEDITDADYVQLKRASKDLEMKTLGEYHDF